MVRGASWWSCRTTRSASTSASRARPWWWNSCAQRCRTLAPALDVTDFGTPVQTVSALQAGDRVRMVVEPRGSWEHSAYQTDNQFVLEVRPKKIDPNKLVQGPGYQGEKLSLNFQNIEVRALLQVIADFTNFNVVTSDTVTGNVTLRLKDARGIRRSTSSCRPRAGHAQVGQRAVDRAEGRTGRQGEARARVAQGQIADLEPVRTQSFQLNYTKAEEVAKGPARAKDGAGRPATPHPDPARQRDLRNADQPALRDRHSVQARRDPGS